MSTITIPTPFSTGGLLYISSGYVGDSLRPAYTIKPGASGDISLGARPSIPVGRARGSCELQTRSAASRCRCASATTCDAVCGRNPHAPFALRRRGAICRVAPPRRCAGASPRRRASQLAPRRSQRGLREYSDGLLAARGESPAAFDRRCVPPGCVAPRSHTTGIFPRRALLGPTSAFVKRGLGATPDFHHGLLGPGKTSSAFIAWSQAQAASHNPSPIVYGDYYYTLFDRGFFTAHDARTGQEVFVALGVQRQDLRAQ